MTSHKRFVTAIFLAMLAQAANAAPNFPVGQDMSRIGLLQSTSIRIPTGDCFWNQFAWDEMTQEEQSAWSILGWNKKNWEGKEDPPWSVQRNWNGLNAGQRGALIDLGYNQKSWDEANC